MPRSGGVVAGRKFAQSGEADLYITQGMYRFCCLYCKACSSCGSADAPPRRRKESSRTFRAVIECKPANIARRMDDVQDDRFPFGDPKADVVTAMYDEPQARPYRIVRYAPMAELRDSMQMVDNPIRELSCGVDIVPGDEVEDLIEIGVGRSVDDQLFRRNRASPREMMSAFIASAPGDFRNSPRW